MIRKRVLGAGASSATMLVQDTESNGVLRVLKRINVSSWNAADVTETLEMYKTIARAKISYVAEVHMTMLQGYFLSLVITYYAGGDLESYLEDGSGSPFEESKVVRWLLVMARVVEQVQSLTGGYFYGLSPDRVFFADGEPGICVGLPMPRYLYFKWLMDREALGVAVEREYPPEVVNERKYKPMVSDVWHLGLLGMKMLSAHTSYSSRSSGIRSIISAMVEQSVDCRLTIAGVVRRLTEILDGQNAPRPFATQRSPTPSLGPDKLKSYGAGLYATAPSTEGSTGDENNGSNGNCINCNIPAKNEVAPAPNTSQRVSRMRLQESWHRRAMEQFEELQRLNASSPVGRSRGCSPTARSRRSRSAGVGLSQSTSAMDMASTAPSPQDIRISGQFQARSPRSFSAKVTKGRTNPTSVVQNALKQHMEEQRRRDAIWQGQETRRLRKQEKERALQNFHQNHVEKLRKIRSKRDEGTKNDIRMHIKQWRDQTRVLADENVIVNREGDVSVFVPKNGRPPPAAATTAPPPPMSSVGTLGRKDKEKDPLAVRAGESKELKEVEGIPVLALPHRATSVPVGSRTTPPSMGPPRFAALYRESGVSPRVPQTRAKVVSTPPPVGTIRGTRGILSISSPRSANGRSLSFFAGAGAIEMPPPLLDPESILDTSVAQETEEVDPFSLSNSGPRDETSLFFSLNGSIKALNESISSLLANHHKHWEVIVAMDKFLMRSEAERCNPRLNAVFMSTLRGILNDEQLFLAAAPLFVQLMALRGLLKKNSLAKTRDLKME
ncbi:Flagellum attachment zone protein 20 [Trypanosoma cruzi]|nr:Flagellum attachment zone protein 20 [Trypanosoma cruzi]